MRYTIRDAAKATGSSPDTLRYYEKIGLVPGPPRTSTGRRAYAEADVARLRFVRRAQSIGFSLREIGELVNLRENPPGCSRAARKLAEEKCRSIEAQLRELEQMRGELSLLLNLCSGDTAHCPILERLDRD